MKLQLRELKAAWPTMPSQGLEPRRSVLPLLISFLFSHIVLAGLSPSLTSHVLLSRPPFSLSFLFPSFFSFFFFSSLRFPFASLLVGLTLYLPSALSRTVGIRVCDSRRERKFLFPFLARRYSFSSCFRDRYDGAAFCHDRSTCWFYRATYYYLS